MLNGAHEAERIVNLIVDHRRNIRPHARAGKIQFDPFSQSAEIFNPSHWLDVDAARLHSALVNCGDAFETAYMAYKRLKRDEQKELFPDGLKP